MARPCVWLVVSAATLLCLGFPKVHGGKIFFPDSPKVEETPTAPPESREERGLWESDLFFLQKLSGLFGGEDESQRRKPAAHSNLRPELLPPQIFFPNRRTGTKHPGHLNHVGVRKGTRVPVRPSQHLPSPRPGSQGFGQPRPDIQGLKPPPPPPPRQDILLVAPPTRDDAPPPEPSGQYSQHQQVAVRPLPPPPTPPRAPGSISPIQPAASFPYQFVRPGNHLPVNNIIPQGPADNTPPRADTPHPNLPPRPIAHPPSLPSRPIAHPPSLPSRPIAHPPSLPSRPFSHTSNLPVHVTAPPISPRPTAPQPPSPPKPVKSKKPTLLGNWGGFTTGTFGNTRRPQKHPRPAPQPQRVIIPPHSKHPQKKDFKPSLEFKPSPQEGKTASDAFQPVFVASPFMDDLGDDVMKPMRVAAPRTTTTTTTTQPVLQDFF